MAVVAILLAYALVGLFCLFPYLVWAHRNNVDELDYQLVGAFILSLWPIAVALVVPALLITYALVALNNKAKQIAKKKR